MSGHTKGPWEFGEGYVPGASTFDLFGLGGRQVIASASYENMWLARYDKDEDAANARLIKSAPCLLEAAREVVRTGLGEEAMHGDQRAAITALRAAITRADGGGA